jgi:sulfate/thiosulfate transport system ATP-binding protein
MALRIENISKNFGETEVLRDISLFTEDGEFLALLGPSGSGKTTLLRVIAGLELPDAGAVRFRDQDLLARPVRERRIGFVFQHYALFKHMTATQNIAFGMTAKPRKRRPPKRAIRDKVAELLALVQLDGFGGRYPSQLSGGQRQRVALARALAIEPDLLLLDEPFGALDAKVRRELRRWLRDLHERTGLTTIFVTHDQEEALELADRVALLREGALEQMGTPEELYHEPASPFVFDFLGDSVRLPCEVKGGIAVIAGAGAPIIGRRAGVDGPATAYARPNDFDVSAADGAGLVGKVRSVLLAGPDARVDCVLDDGAAIEVRLPLEAARKLAPRDRVTVKPRTVRVW